MGWLEVLALLKRFLPLLTRVAPMLETFVAARAGSKGDIDAALERMADNVKSQLAATGQKHDGVAELLGTQAVQVTALAESIRKLQATDDRTAARLLEIESAINALARTLRRMTVLLVSLLVACIGLLVAILLHRST